jgi:3-oxoacyl-[acyl-carrier protein] reductase
MDLGLAGRVLVVTGGTGGLGRATAQALVAEGARVVVSSRSADSVAQTVDALGADRASGVVADNADPQTPTRLIEAAHSTFGRLDGSLVSVGGPPAASALDTTDDQWRSAFESVFLGAMRLSRQIGRSLADAEGGALVLVLSTSVRTPIAGLAASNGLRPGLAMVAKQLATELGPQGVRVVGLLPGRIGTDRMAQLDALRGDPVAARASWEQQIPLRRYGDPAEVGRVATFLLSPAASYVTGTMVAVDGGLLPTP